jgi:urea carboxylase
MFKKVLIANRGAIAVRIIKTLRKMGIASVAIYAEADADAPHVFLADESWSLGEGTAAQTYLDQEKILTIIAQSGAEAVHPGYGFLSENADFGRRLNEQGIGFIGPSPAQMTAFGLKHEARQLAEKNGVPLLPGTGLLDSLDDAALAADVIGYPVMLKSTAGGGGIGMQICLNEAQLRGAWPSIKRLSANNFSNAGVFIEKYIEYARHIEVQIFGDGAGDALVLGDRDCSTQRRHQKVIEEAPAPNIPEQVRVRLHDSARQLVTSVAYGNAGTVEFIYDQKSHNFYFLEVNTRLQVEHGVTELVFGVDLVEWMVRLTAGEMESLDKIRPRLHSVGHAIQARIYAENPARDFQPSAGVLNVVKWPESDGKKLRIDHWIESGTVVSPYYDPMLGKVMCHRATRAEAITALADALDNTVIEGITTNCDYVGRILRTPELLSASIYTRFLNTFEYVPFSCDVLVPGTLTSIQDYPGRVGYWDVGVPPSGPFDDLAFRLGNRLLGNDETAAGLEITFNGPTLKFNCRQQLVLTGAVMEAWLDDRPVPFYEIFAVLPGQVLKLGKITGAGARTYCLFAGGIACENYLGSKSTFTLGQFGGVSGRALRTGDVVNFTQISEHRAPRHLPAQQRPKLQSHWCLRVIYGPHGAPDFFTDSDVEGFFASHWRVHYNSSRTGIRLIGPKPEWARSDGGEAGMHPSNIHDNAYAIGSVDFTGDMPVILGPDGPSLGGFVCPATIIAADLWQLGQLRAGDIVQFIPVSIEQAVLLKQRQNHALSQLDGTALEVSPTAPVTPIIKTVTAEQNGVQVVYRLAGEQNLLVEYGPLQLDLSLRFRAHALMLWVRDQQTKEPLLQSALLDLTPGIRSLQVHYDPLLLPLAELMLWLERAERELQDIQNLQVPSRIVHIPLSWDDAACRLAIEKYMQSVRKDAPWCPSNIEFIRRINGLDSVADVKKIVFDASYVVMGLGDVYLGAPVATPLDPRHRLVTTKYNPARTWTAENSVGIGGSYMCIYGMEGPGGYQFIGRTLQMWNRYRQTQEFTQPWLLRFFDQIRFYEVSAEELQQIRRDFPHGRYSLKIEETEFCLKDYENFLLREQDSISTFVARRNAAFDEELQRWISSGQMQFDSADAASAPQDDALSEQGTAVESPVAGNIWQLLVKPGDRVNAGDVVCILESMKMEIEVTSANSGVVRSICRQQGQSVNAGQAIVVLE